MYCEYLSVWCLSLYVSIMSRTHFRVNLRSIFASVSKKMLARNKRKFWSFIDCIGTPSHNHLVPKPTINHLAQLAKWFSCVQSTHLYGGFDYIFLSCHLWLSKLIHTVQLPKWQELLAPKTRKIQSLNDCNGTPTRNQLLCKRTFNNLTQLAKGFNYVLSNYLYISLYCMILSCHVHVSEIIHVQYLPKYQGNSSSK